LQLKKNLEHWFADCVAAQEQEQEKVGAVGLLVVLPLRKKIRHKKKKLEQLGCYLWMLVVCVLQPRVCAFVVVVVGGGFRIYHSTAVHIQASF
jgi:hypothetical protein